MSSANVKDSLFSRRTLLKGAAISPVAVLPLAWSDTADADPIFALCQAWRDTNAAFEAACFARQNLEAALVRRIGYPRIHILNKGSLPYYAFDAEDVDRMLKGRAKQARRDRLKAKLARREARWNAAASAVGLTEAEKREDALSFKVDDAVNAMADTPATTFAGVAAKLAAAMEIGRVEPHNPGDFPWCYLISALADLRRLTGIAEG